MGVPRLDGTVCSPVHESFGDVTIQIHVVSVVCLDLLEILSMVAGVRAHATVLGVVELGGFEDGSVGSLGSRGDRGGESSGDRIGEGGGIGGIA